MNRDRAKALLLVAIGAVLLSPLAAPQLLAFPYHATSRGSDVWSEQPIAQGSLDAVFDRALKLTSQSPLADPGGERRHVFLTDGGWRWTWLALQNRRTFALSRAFSETVIVNHGDVASDEVRRNAAVGRTRTLSAVIAHEFCHGMERRRYGPIRADIVVPQWLREGYCDHVAQESTLSADDAAKLVAAGGSHPALPYYLGRRRVAALLAANGNDVDALFR